MSNQELQDKYGYVVMGWRGGRKMAIGDVLPSFHGIREGLGIVDCPVVVVGFADVSEWKQQAADADEAERFDWKVAATYPQILKVRAE